ncbi:hypothetical protein BGX26_002672, partial [Mortierella sp. AD094]
MSNPSASRGVLTSGKDIEHTVVEMDVLPHPDYNDSSQAKTGSVSPPSAVAERSAFRVKT